MAVILIGAGGHAGVVAEALRRLGRPIAAVCVETGASGVFAGLPVQGLEALSALHRTGFDEVHVAIGQPQARARLGTALLARGFRLATIVHPAACVADTAELGAGAFVAAGSIVGPSVRIGARAIVNHRCSVDHDAEVGADAHLAPGVLTGGYARIGARSWLGLGTVLRDRVEVGDDSFVGAGSLVLAAIPPRVLAYGQPARVIRPLDQGSWPYP